MASQVKAIYENSKEEIEWALTSKKWLLVLISSCK